MEIKKNSGKFVFSSYNIFPDFPGCHNCHCGFSFWCRKFCKRSPESLWNNWSRFDFMVRGGTSIKNCGFNPTCFLCKVNFQPSHSRWLIKRYCQLVGYGLICGTRTKTVPSTTVSVTIFIYFNWNYRTVLQKMGIGIYGFHSENNVCEKNLT